MIEPHRRREPHRTARHGAPTPGPRSLGSSELHCGVDLEFPASLLLIIFILP